MATIKTEKTLVCGNAKMSEGTDAYIRFKEDGKIKWMHAELLSLDDEITSFIPTGGVTRVIKVKPEDILLITDTDIPDTVDVSKVYKGHVVEEKDCNLNVPVKVKEQTYYGRDSTTYGKCPTCNQPVSNGIAGVTDICPKCRTKLCW